ncbi:carbohydrate sulfotransferase 9-like [Pecten maximus]|uniref:carbohydrate sulfotransferase 9-like n=1 Tax=Pecten maximus TaxID=6579 RepID=UPI0014584E42|nr:carbohydrate sulfotransferase 9-like [Pecten maximus]
MSEISHHRDIKSCQRRMPRRSSFLFYSIGMSIIFVWYAMAILDAKSAIGKLNERTTVSHHDVYSPNLIKSSQTKEQRHTAIDRKTLEMYNRKETLQSWCKMFKERDRDIEMYGEIHRTFFYSKSARLGVCKVPKTGCSFMAKFFFALEPKMTVVKAFTMDRYEVHNGAYEYDEDFMLKTLKTHQPFTAVVSRDPYRRLFSAYIDKVFLIGKLNQKFGQVLRSRLYQTQEESCGYSISFQEFLDQVVAMAAQDEYDEHWLPVSKRCDPCRFRYDFICNTETLDSDLYHILDRINLTEDRIAAIKNSIATEKQNKNEVMSLIKTTMYDHRRFVSVCPNVLDLMEKTWTSLQIRGYIHQASQFPRERFWTMKKGKLKVGKINDEDLINTVYEEFLNRPLTPKQMASQRHRSLVRAYRNIKPETIAKIQKMYEYDFFLFNYGLEPPGKRKR